MFEHNLKPRRKRVRSGHLWAAAGVIALIAIIAAGSAILIRDASKTATAARSTVQAPPPSAPAVLDAFDSRAPNLPAPAADSRPILNPLIPAPQFSAQSVLVYEPNGPILYSLNPTQEFPIASLTKLMTAYVAVNDSRFDQAVTIAAADHVSIAPVLHVLPGDRIYPEDLLKSMLIGSANDAAQTLADHFDTPLETFIDRMNDAAKSLGMYQTSYSTPIGFDDNGNYSTAEDLQKLVNADIPLLPFTDTEHAASYSFAAASPDKTAYHIAASSTLGSQDPTIGVLKTGFTDDAKQAMIATETIQGHAVISIVLESNDRETDTAAVLRYVAKAYAWPQ